MEPGRTERLIAAVVVSACLGSPGGAASAEATLSGYAKTSAQSGKSAVDGSRRWASLSRLRLDGTISAFDGAFKVNVVDDTGFLTGSLLGSREFALAAAAPSPHRWDLEAAPVDDRWRRFTNRLYRATLQASAASVTAIAGRQRIAWGTGRVWNPSDVLNPWNPLAIERDERPGVDAVLLTRPWGDLGKASAVYARHRGAESWLGRAARTLGETDVALTAGRTRGEWMAAAEFTAQAFGAGVRAEAAAFAGEHRAPVWRADGSLDRGVGGGVTLGLEGLFDSAGEGDRHRYRYLDLVAGLRRTLARHYVAATARWEITPLLALDALEIVNADDASAFLNARLTWAALEDLELVAGGQLPSGGAGSEYGRLEPAIFGWLVRYF